MRPNAQADAGALPGIGVNPGYALGRLAKALRTSETHADLTTRERAERKVASWVAVYEGLLSGALRVGSRTPVADTPAWATLDVAHGGFATGSFLAGGPLLPHERERLARLPASPEGAERGALNASYLTDEGLAELGNLLDSGRYRLGVPEEGALLAVAWLIRDGNADAARSVLDTIGPFLDRLRFYPIPDPTPLDGGAVVFLQSVGTTAAQLAALRPRPAVLAQREAIAVWVPLFDRLAALFLETVEGEIPSLRRGESGTPEKTADGRFVVEGGWPCQRYPDGWRDRARALLAEYERLRAENRLCCKPEQAKRNFARLRGFLETCVTDPHRLSGREVGLIRLILAGVVNRHGLSDSPAGEARRRRQVAQASAPTPAEFARVLGDRLAKYPRDGGLDTLDAVAGPVAAEEATRHRVPAGRAVPPSLLKKLRRSLAAEVPVLVEAGVIPSAETLAQVIPQITAQVRSAGIGDPALRRLYQAIYGAFRRRRSLLLLNLESQVKLSEIPWVAAIDPYRRSGLDARERARQTLEQLATVAVTGFPQQILPNKLLQEVRALAEEAGLKLPIVDEVAADIFMGDFSEKFLRAAQTAALVLGGSLYERYYGLPYHRVRAIDDVGTPRYGAATSPAFVRLCTELAGAGKSSRGPVAHNGTIIEQEQILTTHNLAVLFEALGLRDALGRRLRGLAERCFAWVCRTLQQQRDPWKAKLQAVKNAAYAWRQMVFFLALLPEDELREFLARAEEHLAKQRPGFRDRFGPALEGLRLAAGGTPGDAGAGPKRFLGWTTGKHWLLA